MLSINDQFTQFRLITSSIAMKISTSNVLIIPFSEIAIKRSITNTLIVSYFIN